MSLKTRTLYFWTRKKQLAQTSVSCWKIFLSFATFYPKLLIFTYLYIYPILPKGRRFINIVFRMLSFWKGYIQFVLYDIYIASCLTKTSNYWFTFYNARCESDTIIKYRLWKLTCNYLQPKECIWREVIFSLTSRDYESLLIKEYYTNSCQKKLKS